MIASTSNAFAPTIETERLILRSHRLEDFPACSAMWSDPIVVRYIGGKPSTQQQTWMRILAYRGHWTLMGFGYWAIEEKGSGKFAGELGFADFKRDIAPSMQGAPELGWALASPFHGKGYATEAVRAVLEWADANLTSQRTVCLIDPENAASIRVAEKAGYRQFDRAVFGEKPTLFFDRSHAAPR